jgi:UDP-glucuronate 4-epimerase
MKVLVTGGAGFIGSATTKALIDRGDEVVMIDNFNDYYNPQLKRDRLSIFLKDYAGKFTVYEGDIRDRAFLDTLFSRESIDKVIHLAAMAGVRNSLLDPSLYVDVNIQGTVNIFDMSVKYGIKNCIYASSSSVYGGNEKMPFSESDPVDKPVSPYAATKKATELMAHVYHHIHKLNVTGLRFFTVYGPWGRPDMGVFGFVEKIVKNETIDVYNFGKMRRNFTYIDDIVSGILTVLDADLACEVMNIGGDKDDALLDYIATIEKHVGNTVEKNLMPMQPGDVVSIVADITKHRAMGWAPTTRIDEGVKNFVEWYREYYKI